MSFLSIVPNFCLGGDPAGASRGWPNAKLCAASRKSPAL